MLPPISMYMKLIFFESHLSIACLFFSSVPINIYDLWETADVFVFRILFFVKSRQLERHSFYFPPTISQHVLILCSLLKGF